MMFRSRKEKIILGVCSVFIILPYVFILMCYTNKIHYLYAEDYMETDLLACAIYEIDLDGTFLYIEGGIAQKGVAENYTRENKYLYFKNNDTSEMYVTRIGEMVIGDKLTNYINDGKDYSIGGFAAKLNLKSLDIENNSYSIYCGEQHLGINMITDTLIDINYGKINFTDAHDSTY